MFTFTGAKIREQGVTFAIVIVKPFVLRNIGDRESAQRNFSRYFPDCPLILATQDSSGNFTYFGRRDIVNFLAHLDPRRIPWRRYHIN